MFCGLICIIENIITVLGVGMLIIMIIALAVTVAACVFLFKYSEKKEGLKKLCLLTVCFLILSFGLELTLFNVNKYTSANYNEISLNSSLETNKTNEGIYTFSGDRDTIYIPEFNEKINNLYFDIANKNENNIEVEIFLTDDANKNLFSCPERTINACVEKSKYINIHTSGVSKSLAVRFLLDEDESVSLYSLSANKPRSFDFSPLRILTVILLCVFIYIFKPSSVLYKMKLTENKELKNSLCASLIILETVLITVTALINPAFVGVASKNYNSYKWDGNGIDFVSLQMKNHNQYDELAQAMLKGKTYIDNGDVPDFLLEMENPYDTAARTSEENKTGKTARWDVAFFNGHYYVYFGIVPLLLMYLPCRAIFDAPFPSALGIIIFSVFFTIGVYKLLSLIAEKRLKNISVASFLLLVLTFINCCGMMFLVKRPDFYSVPIITGMTFTVFGIYCWLKSFEVKKRKPLYLFAGSLCMALVAGCRPQMLLVSAVALPIFLPHFFKNKFILKKDGIKQLAVLAVPYVAVAAGIMYYNFIRFGSPFDFGSSYNLTTNDVTKRGFDFGRAGLGIFTYLFQPPSFTGVFPFIKKTVIETNYAGKTIYENCFGGLVTSLPLLWFAFALFKVKDGLKKKNLFGITSVLLVTGIAIVIADTEAGGLLQRYFSDFAFLFFIVAAVTIFELIENAVTNREKQSLDTLVFLASCLSLTYSVLLVFSVSDVTIDTQNPSLFTYIAQAVQFWL